MKHWIGMDYGRGLSMLKEYVETGTVISQVEIMGVNSIPVTPYIGFSKTCQLKEIGDVMLGCYQQLNTFLVDNSLPTDIIPFAVYDYLDKDTQKVHFTAAVPVPANTPDSDSLTYGELPAMEALQINHLGRHTHLGNAWSTGMIYARNKKI